jgi:predicted nucleotidyltransferase
LGSNPLFLAAQTAARYHEPNRRLAMKRRPLSQRETEALREFSTRIRAALGSNLLELRLFGSKARGDSRPDSDLDVLVVVTGDRVGAEDLAIDIAFDINVASDLYISPRVVTAGSLTDPVWRTTLFVQTITRESVAL